MKVQSKDDEFRGKRGINYRVNVDDETNEQID